MRKYTINEERRNQMRLIEENSIYTFIDNLNFINNN